ncbi:hypothetical protein OC846_002643 [Tilletia horrida]|uniref:CRIB domain-containing protein n=1 Tax=Tilletia horrida TaxID=155126 RepID=A0AAN6GTM3_9BASI|nr:hypothetical protein OC846_002643 [Tilletia horrida]KAK0569735.1 hypothetical protein OC861_000697 [Tilletia horrida]
MPALLSGCRSGASFDSLPRGQRGPNAAINRLKQQQQQQKQEQHQASDGTDSEFGSSTPRTSLSLATNGTGHNSEAPSPTKDNVKIQSPKMRPVENLAKVERTRSSPFPRSAPTSPAVHHPQAHSHHGPGASATPTRAKHRIVHKDQIGLPTNFKHTGHIGRSSYSAATSLMSSAAIQEQLSQVAAALNLDSADPTDPRPQQSIVSPPKEIPIETLPEEACQPIDAEPVEIKAPAPEAIPVDVPAAAEALPRPIDSEPLATSRLEEEPAEGSLRLVNPRPLVPLDTTIPTNVTKAPQQSTEDAAAAFPYAQLTRFNSTRSGATPSTVSAASRKPSTSRPAVPRTAGPSQGQALRRKPVPRAVEFADPTPTEKEVLTAATSADSLPKSPDTTLDEAEEGEEVKPVPVIPAGTIRINGKAFVQGPSGSLITRTANTRWNSALAEITAALAADLDAVDISGGNGAIPNYSMSKEEEEKLMLRMGIPLGPSTRSNQAEGGAAAGPGETVKLKAELADLAHAINVMDNADS